MNIPTKVLRSTFITYEAYFHHQQLAKRFYKSTKGKKLAKQNSSVDAENKLFTENEQISYPVGELKSNFKEELMKWFFSMSLPERIKAVSIENKWFSTMVQHMYTKFKNDQKIRFQLKFDDVTAEELCYQQYFNPPQSSFSNELNLDNFFYFKNDRYISEDRSVNENLFLKELRYYSLREQNDTLTLSTSLLENEPLFKYFLDTFSNDKAFLHYCTFDNVLKVYNWDFPDWFNPRDYNSISEFIIAYIEQVLSIRFWFALEEKKEKSSKSIPIISFSLCEEPNFNELFDNREKLVNFLINEYRTCKEKLFSNTIDLKKIISELKNDTNLMSKIRKPKPENIKNYFYLIKNTKYELFEPPVDNDHEIIDKIKKFYYEQSEDRFLDELIFFRLETISSLEDYLFKKIFEVLHNIYTEKNAIDLMNEELSVKKPSESVYKSKRGRVKKSVNKKKARTESVLNENSVNNVNNKDNENLGAKRMSNSPDINIHNNNPNNVESNTDDYSSPAENKKVISFIPLNTDKVISIVQQEEDKSDSTNINMNNSNTQNNINVQSTTKPKEQSQNLVALTINNYDEKKQLQNPQKTTTNETNTNVESNKMSWRKMTAPNDEEKKPIINTNPHLSNKKKKLSKSKHETLVELEDKPPVNNDEKYVNDLVKNLLNQIITGEDKTDKTGKDKIEKSEKHDSGHLIVDKSLDNEYEDLRAGTYNKNHYSKNNKQRKNKAAGVVVVVNSKMNPNNNLSSITPPSNNYCKNKNLKPQKLMFDENSNHNIQNSKTSSLKSKQYKKQYKKDKENQQNEPIKKVVEFHKNDETSEITQNTEATQNQQESNTNLNSLISPFNLPSSKNYSSDNECIIETMNHEILQTGSNPSKLTHFDLRKQMVDNFSQTDPNKEKALAKAADDAASKNLSEAVQSSTHDEEEKPKEVRCEEEKMMSNLNSNKNEKPQKKKKKSLYINNFKQERESENSQIYSGACSTNKISPMNDSKKIRSCSNTEDFGLKKAISEEYQFNAKNDVKSVNSNANFNYNYVNTPPDNLSAANSRKSSFYSVNTQQDRYNHSYNNHNEEEYQTDGSYSPSFNKTSRCGYSKNYYGGTGGFYGKKSKFSSNNNNYYGFNSNKFNSADQSFLINKQINNRPFYSRSSFDYSPYYPNPSHYSMLGNYPMYPSADTKDPPIYNNYYIINSNVNINNVHNFTPAEKDKEANVERDATPKDLNKNLNILSSYNNGTVCNNFVNYSIPEGYKGGNNFTMNSSQGMFNYPSILFHGAGVKQNEPNVTEDNNPNQTNILSKIEGDIYPFIFHYRIHNDILEYSNSVNEVVAYFKDIKLYIIKYLEKTIKNALSFELITDLYGSFATDLSIESSDIDITVKFSEERNEVEIDDIIQKLCFHFKSLKVFDVINPIFTASVPVIKILIDPAKVLEKDSEEMKQFSDLKNSEIYKNYRFDLEELMKVKVDLTFFELNNRNNISGFQSTKSSLDWAKKTLNTYPEIKPIIHVLKRYLQIKKLNSSFNGGLSSFSLFLLIVAYLKYPKIKTRFNLGRVLMEILEMYGKFFQYSQSIIDINAVNPYVFTNDLLEKFPVILDPMTGLNVAKNSFRIEEVRESFSNAYDFLNRLKILFDKKDLPNSANVVLDLMLQNSRSSNLK